MNEPKKHTQIKTWTNEQKINKRRSKNEINR